MSVLQKREIDPMSVEANFIITSEVNNLKIKEKSTVFLEK